MLVTCTETQISSSPTPTSYGTRTSSSPVSTLQRGLTLRSGKEEQDVQALQERMPPCMSLALLYILIFLLVLNVEIVVPTADDYATRLGASETFSGLVIALTPFWQGILGIPMNYTMLRHGVPMKSIIIIMVAGSVLGNVLYAMAGLMHSKLVILAARTMVGICQCQLAGPIYIAWTVGVKKRTKVLFMYSTMTAVAFCCAPLIAALLEIFVKELRIEDLVLNSDTIPGWFMAMLYFIYLLLVVFFFEDVADPQVSSPTPPEPAEGEPQEKFWKPGLLTCLLASFLSPTTSTMCIVFFVKLAEKTWSLSVSATGFYLAAAMGVVALMSFASSAVTPYVEDRKGLLITSLCACVSATLTFHIGHSWDTASVVVFILGFLLMQSCSGVVKNYGYALVPKIVAPEYKDNAGFANMVVIQLGRGLGAQLGAVFNTTTFAASQVGSYFVLAVLAACFTGQLKQHAKAM
ncbi:SPX domain-containing membrane protein At4g22990 [Durusdinium trenchii]